MPQAIWSAIVWVATATTWQALVVRTLLVFGVSALQARRQLSGFGQSDAGARVQLAPATDNLLPVVYGKAYIAPVITDAKISNDNKVMWYCCTLTEVPDTATITFGDIYWNGALVSLGTGQYGGASSVTSTTNNAGEYDAKMNGFIEIFKFPNGVAGSQAGGNTGSTSAVTIMSDPTIPASLRWDGNGGTNIYGTNGQSVTMSDTAFLIVKVTYNVDADTTRLGDLTVEVQNSIDKPGDVMLDYLQNTRYGCAVPLSQIDTASLTALDVYSDQLITFTPIGAESPTQARYRINGPINTAQTCMTNLQEIADACDSWIQYNSLTNQWKVVINKPYVGAIANLYHVDASYNNTQANLVGGIDVNPIDLNSTYNSLQVAYPNESIRDQTDYQLFDLADYNTAVMSPNEPENKLDINLPQVNNYIQAAYIGIRRLLQSREDLVVSFRTDYSGIQVEAGDVIRISSAEYGWDGASFPDGKLFRVTTVNEVSDQSNNLYAEITAFEYNATIYNDGALTNFVPADNTGLASPNIINTPALPTAAVTTDGSLATLRITALIPTGGITQYLDFNYGTQADSATHELYRTVSLSNGNPFTPGSTYTIDINDLPPGTLYFSIVARNQMVGVRGASSAAIVWAGTNINPQVNYFPTNCSSSGTTITCNPVVGLPVGAYVYVTSGTGQFAASTTITQVDSTTQFIVSATPTIALSGADVRAEFAGLPPNSVGTVQIVDLAVVTDKMADLAIIESKLADNAVARVKLLDGAVNSVKLATAAVEELNIATNAVTEVKIDNDSISAPKIKTNAVTTDKIDTNAVTAGKILAGTIDATRISTGTLTSASGVFGTISADNVTVGTLNGSTVNITNLNANNITSGTINAAIINVGNIDANEITTGTLNTARLNVADIVTTGSLIVAGGNVSANGNGGVTQITGDVITTGTVNAAYIDVAGVITIGSLTTGAGVNANVTSISGNAITTGTIDASVVNVDNINANNISTGTLAAARIDVADLVLPVAFDVVSGATIGSWNDNQLRLKRVGAIGTEPGIYSGYVKVNGQNAQVKTVAIAIGDGTYGGAGNQLRNDIEYNEATQNGTSASIPIATTGSAQMSSGASQYWSKIDRFNSIYAIAQLSIIFRKTSTNATTSYLYINAQGDGGTRALGSVEYAFYRFSEA